MVSLIPYYIFLMALVTCALATGSMAGPGKPIMLASGVRTAVADADFGQCFTVHAPIQIHSIEVFAKRSSGGSAFTLTVRFYDPWTKTQGPVICSKTVPLSEVPADAQGNWVEVTFDLPGSIATPGIYGFFFDTLSPGGSAGFNSYGYALGDSIAGGHLVGGNLGSGSPWEVAFNLRGTGDPAAFQQPPLPPVHLAPPSIQTSSNFRPTITTTYSWDTSPAFVYRLWTSAQLKYWTAYDYIGDGTRKSKLSINSSNGALTSEFARLEVMRMGDYKK